MESEIIEREGKIFIMDPWDTCDYKPVRFRKVWPTGLLSIDYNGLIGKKAIYKNNGIYQVNLLGLCKETYIKLQYGDKTNPDPLYSTMENGINTKIQF